MECTVAKRSFSVKGKAFIRYTSYFVGPTSVYYTAVCDDWPESELPANKRRENGNNVWNLTPLARGPTLSK